VDVGIRLWFVHHCNLTCMYVYGSHALHNVEAYLCNVTSTHLTVNSNDIGYIHIPLYGSWWKLWEFPCIVQKNYFGQLEKLCFPMLKLHPECSCAWWWPTVQENVHFQDWNLYKKENQLRSTMRQQRLNWLSLMSMENDIMKTIDFKPIINNSLQRNFANVCVEHFMYTL
jgi:hypothetical protein